MASRRAGRPPRVPAPTAAAAGGASASAPRPPPSTEPRAMRRAASGPDGGDSGAAEARRQPAAFEAVADAACRRAEQLVQQMMRLHDDSLEPDYDSGRAPFLAPGGLDLARAKAANRALRGVVGAAASALAASRAALLGARADLDAASVSACAARVAFAVPRCGPTFGCLHATLSVSLRASDRQRQQGRDRPPRCAPRC